MHNRMCIFGNVLFILFLFAYPGQSAIADSGKSIRNGCATAAHRQFDFWLGDWEIYESEDPDGPPIGTANVSRIVGGCALSERYLQDDGLRAESIISYDAVSRKWQQTWVTNGGSLMIVSGNVNEGVMTLEGESRRGNGTVKLQRVFWRKHSDHIREWAVESEDGGVTWTPAFDVLFRRISTSVPNE